MEQNPNVKVVLEEGAFLPTRAHDTDAGADVRTPNAFIVYPNSSTTVYTGIHVETPANCVTMVKSKSGLNVKRNIVAEGVIDEGYDGEIVVKVRNFGGVAQTFERGDKIAQLVIMPVVYPTYVEADSISSGERGSNGFGSTGR